MALFKKQEDSDWSSVSDLMSGLMMLFLLIAIAYMLNVAEGQQKVKRIAVTYQEIQLSLYNDLMNEFKEDLPKWKAHIDQKTLAIQFMEPDILFSLGKAEINERFREILDDFFPRYMAIICSDKFRDSVEEIRIEGHTSSEWGNREVSLDEAYFNNMALSQERTRSVLSYCYHLDSVVEYKNFMRSHITANGLSSSQPILFKDGTENTKLSRRVEFRTRTNADQRIVQILDELQYD